MRRDLLLRDFARPMRSMHRMIASAAVRLPAGRIWLALLAALLVGSSLAIPPPARAADPAVVYMAQVGKELMAAARSRSPSMLATVIQKHGDITYIGLYALGSYRSKLAQTEKPEYLAGTTRFMARYAASKAPDYQVERVEWSNASVRGGSGTMVDSTVYLRDGSSYEVRWLLSKSGSGYKVRDASVLGFWMTGQLKTMFEDYVSQNGGSVRALTSVLNR